MTTQNPAQVQNLSPAATFNRFLNKHKGQLAAALPKHLSADRMVRLALTAFSQNKDLANCDETSVFASIIVAAQLGLEIGVNGQAYLIPYRSRNGWVCNFVPGWKGLVDLVSRSGRASVWTGAVYEGDEFDYMLGDSPYCKHKPTGEFDLDKLTHVYAIGRIKDSVVPVIEVWTVKKVDSHLKKYNKVGANHYALKDDKKNYEMYARKVALLQVLKYMPQSTELATAIDLDGAFESGRPVTIDGDFVVFDQENQNSESESQATTNETLFMNDESIVAIQKELSAAQDFNQLNLIYDSRVIPYRKKIHPAQLTILQASYDQNNERIASSVEETGELFQENPA